MLCIDIKSAAPDAWFDQAFFDDRRDAWFGAMHTRIYQGLGIPLDNVTVTHWTALAS